MRSGRLQMAVFCVRVLQHVFRLILEYFPHFVHRHEAWEEQEREGEKGEKERHPACIDNNTPDGAENYDFFSSVRIFK